jgi:hypothetical protein
MKGNPMKVASCFFALFFVAALAAPAALGAPVLKNGDRWPVSSPRAVAVDTVDHLVFMARGNMLTVLSDALAVRSRIDLDAEIRCISYSNGYIFAATGSQGLVLVDVTDPTDPQQRSTFTPTDGSAVASVYASGDYAYITNAGNRFKIVDVSDPSDPDEIGAEALPGLLVSAVNVDVSDDVAAVVDQVNGLHLLTISDKTDPQWESLTPIAGAFDVRLDGSYAYVASIAGGLDIVDIAEISDPEPRGSYAPVDGYSVGVLVDGDTAWLADQVNGLHRIDIADKDAPAWQQTYGGTTGAYSVATGGTSAYVCDHERGLQQLVAGARVNTYRPLASAQNLFVDDDEYLYMVDSAADGEGLRILDAFNPGNVGYLGFVETPGQAHGVFVDGDYAYVADGNSGLQIINISDKSNPVISGTQMTADSAQAVSVSGNYAYIADLAAGLRVIDVSAPAAPSIVGSCSTSDIAYGVAVSGNYAYVADGLSGLHVIDVSNPASPLPVGSCDTPGSARDVYISGTNAYVADNTSGVQVINVADKTNPQIIGSYDTGNANGIFVSGNIANVADMENGLVTLDVSDPASPSKIDDWSTGTTASALHLHVAGEYVYVAEGLGGAAIYQLSDEDPFVPTQSSGSGGGGGCFITSLGL